MLKLGGKSIRRLQEPNTFSPLTCGILNANPLCLHRLEMASTSFWGLQLLVVTLSFSLALFVPFQIAHHFGMTHS